ncbi:MAG TPA: hypothetical protein VJ776_08685, partial [Thermoanaerobaculia bacterium]|nr:hypothetical protein [Thermoanaerobaculia bacterium]
PAQAGSELSVKHEGPALDDTGSIRPGREGILARPLPGRLPETAFSVATALATIALWVFSRGKWGSAIVDSGREWIVPACLARGELLYRDVVYWFGPFTPYLHALLFRLFGPTFRTLVLAGVATSAALLAVLLLALRRVTGRGEAVLGTILTVPLLLFMPSAGGAILGMGYRMWHAAAFTLLAVALAVRPSRSWARAAGIGCLCALAGLCRTEWGLAAMGGVFVAAAARDRFRPSFLREIALAALGFVVVGGGVLAAFVAVAGPEAVLREGHVLLTGLPVETRRFLLNNSGFHDPFGGSLRLVYSAALWVGIFLLIEAAACWKRDRALLKRRLPWLGGIAAYLLLYADYGGPWRYRLMSAAPLIGLFAVFFGFRRWGGPKSAALAGFGSLALVLSYRKLFSISDSAYVAPPLLFAVVSGLGLLREIVASKRARMPRLRVRRWIQLALVCLVFVSFADRIVLYGSDDRVTLPGTEGMLSARSETVQTLSMLSEAIRRRTGPAEGLVVFPEGEVLNYLSGRRNPVRHKLYIPGYVSSDNEAAVLSELQIASPAAVVIVNRATPEYGRRFFGEDYAKTIAHWIDVNYTLFPFDPREEVPPESGARLFLRKPSAGRFRASLPDGGR